MNRSPFATLVFRGARFDSKVMPLDALPELAAYQDLIIEVAKGLFRGAHPERKRIRKHFETGLRLVLAQVEPGSAVPIVERLFEPGALPFPPGWGDEDFFESARDIVEAAILSASTGLPLPSRFPEEAVAKFNMFGRGLHADESVVVAAPGKREGATYNKEVRKKILLTHGQNYEDEILLSGLVRAADLDAEKFSLRTDGGQRVEVRCSPLFLPVALRGFTRGDVHVRVKGIGVFDKRDRLIEVSNTFDVSLEDDADQALDSRGCPTPVGYQVDSLLMLGEGWLEGKGVVPSRGSVEWLKELLSGVTRGFDLPDPFIYPTPEGSARAEWPTAGWEIVAEIDPVARTAALFAVHLSDDVVDEESLDFSHAGAETSLGRFVADHLRR